MDLEKTQKLMSKNYIRRKKCNFLSPPTIHKNWEMYSNFHVSNALPKNYTRPRRGAGEAEDGISRAVADAAELPPPALVLFFDIWALSLAVSSKTDSKLLPSLSLQCTSNYFVELDSKIAGKGCIRFAGTVLLEWRLD